MAWGVDAAGVVSGSVRQPPHQLRRALVQRGLAALALPAGVAADPIQVLAALGDPFKPFGLGLLQGCCCRGGPQVVLAGGSQMLALQALLLACLDPAERTLACRQLVVATTSWVMGEQGSNLPELARRLAALGGEAPVGACSAAL